MLVLTKTFYTHTLIKQATQHTPMQIIKATTAFGMICSTLKSKLKQKGLKVAILDIYLDKKHVSWSIDHICSYLSNVQDILQLLGKKKKKGS